MRNRWTAVTVAAALVAILATVLGLRAWGERPPGDVGTGAIAAAAAPAAVASATATASPPAGSSATPTPTSPAIAPVGRRLATAAPPVLAPSPVAVSVPRLRVTAPVDPVGVQDNGEMTIPPDGARVGWYRYGAAPGAAAGSAVIAGHVDTSAGGRGAFYPLSAAKVGDEVRVRLDDGSERRYRIAGREQITKKKLPVDAVFGRSGPPRLTLITCGGPFDRERGRYRDNLVITAEPLG